MTLEISVRKKLDDFQLNADFIVTGTRTGIYGPSGSGKSTLTLLLSGLMKPDDGRIRLNGSVLFDKTNYINILPEKRRIGVVFQHAHLFPHMNVRQNLFYGFNRTSHDERKISPELLIKTLDIGHLLERNVTRLSGGERQRVALGRTLLASPHFILMDEPLTGLDLSLKYQIMPYLNRVLDEFHVPFLFISHSIEEMRLMCDEVLVFSKGEMVSRISSEDLARQNLATGNTGYANYIVLNDPMPHGDLWQYTWGGTTLILTDPGNPGENVFKLTAKDITLFKCHPEASSARNLLSCSVVELFGVGNRVGVVLECNKNRLVCQIVPESVKELDIKPGSLIIAAVKASAFRRMF